MNRARAYEDVCMCVCVCERERERERERLCRSRHVLVSFFLFEMTLRQVASTTSITW